MSSAQIHDLGYRGYDGSRLGELPVARSLFTTGLRHVFGLGRPVKARLLPMGILLCSLLPALVMVSVVAMFHVPQLPVGYRAYPFMMQLLTAVFVAAQAPVLFSRDLRYRTITLYLARPMRRATYVASRLLSLWAAILVVVGAPLLILLVGALLGGLPAGDQWREFLKAVPAVLVLTTLLTVVAGAISAMTVRRGLAVVGIVGVLVVGSGIATALGAIVQSSTGSVGLHASWPGILNPFTLAQGMQAWWYHDASSALPPPDSAVDGTVYVVGAILTVVGCVALVLRRYAKGAAA